MHRDPQFTSTQSPTQDLVLFGNADLADTMCQGEGGSLKRGAKELHCGALCRGVGGTGDVAQWVE